VKSHYLLRLVLHSSKAIRKETVQVTSCFRRSSPDPGLGSMVELSRGDTGCLLNLVRIGKALPSQGIASEEAPPALWAALSQQAPVGMKT
jgi:hypothetical protein